MGKERMPHDPAYKQFFSNPEMVESLLRDFVSADFIADLDFSTLERCLGSYVTADCGNAMTILSGVSAGKGAWCYVALLLEFVRRVGMSIKWITIPPDERGVCAQVSGALTG